MRVGILELLVDTANEHTASAFARYLRRQYYSIMPQAVAVWCRELGRRVSYATYYGQASPDRLLPDDLDVVFIAAYTQSAALAYVLAKLFREKGALTVLGGPHAKAFPETCLRHVDLVVKECDKTLIADILSGQFDPPAVISSGRGPTGLPSVEERMPEIAATAFPAGRPSRVSMIALLSSLGCPYSCDFCTDWNTRYVVMPPDQLAADLRFVADRFPQVLVAFHDPNFAVRFDETMAVLESVPKGRRNRYVMESSLSILKASRLKELKETNCYFVAPGVESWDDYSNKAGTSGKHGRQKLEQVVDHFRCLKEVVPGLQANFLFGTDLDRGREPVELTIEFMRRLPYVWPGVNIPTPFGGTPLFDRYLAEGRILKAFPIELYFAPYLATTLKHYEPLEYYSLMIEIYEAMTSRTMLARRLATSGRPAIGFAHVLRTWAMRQELAEMRVIRAQLASDATFRAFHEGRNQVLPEFYHRRYEQRLGPYAGLLARAERVSVFG